MNQMQNHPAFVPDKIKHWAKETPDGTAVIASDGILRYAELDALSDRAAQGFLHLTAGAAGCRAGLLLERKSYVFALELGIVRAGGAYIPMTTEYPETRISYILEDAGAALLITTREILKSKPLLRTGKYRIVLTEELLFYTGETRRLPEITPGQLTHIIYTSGSTGQPKGVRITALADALSCCADAPRTGLYAAVENKKTLLAVTQLSFVASNMDYTALYAGGTVCLADDAELKNMGLLTEKALRHKVKSMFMTPSYCKAFLCAEAGRAVISSLDTLVLAGEKAPAGVCDAVFSVNPEIRLVCVYGCTEANGVLFTSLSTAGKRETGLGQPQPCLAYEIVDDGGKPVAAGENGELILSGDSITPGYTDAKSSAAAFTVYAGKRCFRTGDIVRRDADGTLLITGRRDDMVKFHGQRVELGEIESVLCDYPGIGLGKVLLKEHNGSEFLAAFYTAVNEVDKAALSEYLRAWLPPYMVPGVLVCLPAMPLNANKKIDRLQLLSMDVAPSPDAYAPPENAAEKRLCEAFAATLELPANSVGRDTDFYALGGDSLKTMALLSAASIDTLTAADVYRERTPAAIAALLSARNTRENPAEREALSRAVPHALSPMQQKMLDYQLYRPDSTMWSNMHALFRFEKTVDPDRLCRAVNAAVLAHPGLHVAFSFSADLSLQQQYRPELYEEIRIEETTEEAIEVLRHTLIKPFERLFNARLYRLRLFRTEKYSYLFMDIHHLLMDGGSLTVLSRDIAHAYCGREIPQDFYFSLLDRADKAQSGESSAADKAYFADMYGLSRLDWSVLPQPDADAGEAGSAGRVEKLSFTREEMTAAEKFWGVSLNTMAVAAALVSLSRYNHTDKVMTNWIFNNRLAPESENTVGMLIRNLPVGVKISKYRTARSLLREVKKQIDNGIAHADYDYFAAGDSAFATDPMEVNLQVGIGTKSLDSLPHEFLPLDNPYVAAGARLELELFIDPKSGAYCSELEYAKEIYREENILAFHDDYIRVLEALVKRQAPEGLQ